MPLPTSGRDAAAFRGPASTWVPAVLGQGKPASDVVGVPLQGADITRIDIKTRRSDAGRSFRFLATLGSTGDTYNLRWGKSEEDAETLVPVSYTLLGGDDLTDLYTGLKAAIEAVEIYDSIFTVSLVTEDAVSYLLVVTDNIDIPLATCGMDEGNTGTIVCRADALVYGVVPWLKAAGQGASSGWRFPIFGAMLPETVLFYIQQGVTTDLPSEAQPPLRVFGGMDTIYPFNTSGMAELYLQVFGVPHFLGAFVNEPNTTYFDPTILVGPALP